MKNTSSSEAYISQGEYVTFFDKDFISMGIEESMAIRSRALSIAKEDEVEPRKRKGSGITRDRVTVTLPREIWKKAYNNLTE